jgi:hypothetical protein
MTATLKAADLPVSDFTLKALSAWSSSTPILPYTNNPLGMPAVKGKTLELMRTGYAMFPTMGDMRNAFADFISSSPGNQLHDALALNEKHSQVWRAVHALPWPANNTETDWPSAVLDLTSESYRSKAASVTSPADRKTSGVIGTQTDFGGGSAASSRLAAQTAIAIQQATNAVRQIPGRMR